MITLLMEKEVTKEPVKKELKYKRLIDRMTELINLYHQDKNVEYLKEDDCIGHFFECEGYQTYEEIASFAKANQIERIVDIGCAYGHQSEVFLKEELQYIGVSDHKSNFWNNDKYEYIVNHYPCELPLQKGDLGVSVLCLTWNCYLYDKEQTLKRQCEALQHDFEHCLLYIQSDKLDFVGSYFKKVEKIGSNLYYFSNK